MASPSSSDIAEMYQEDQELQRALALSLEEAAPTQRAVAEAAPAASPRAGRRQPMRGRRTAATQKQQQQQQQQQPVAREPAAAAQQPQRPLPQQRRSPAPAKPAGVSKPPPGGGSGRKPRGKKLPAYNPTDAEVEACFKLLAGGGAAATISSLIEASQALGCGQELPAVQLMMSHAAEHVLGWASGPGRGQGARGQLSLPEFHAVVDHFRVAG